MLLYRDAKSKPSACIAETGSGKTCLRETGRLLVWRLPVWQPGTYMSHKQAARHDRTGLSAGIGKRGREQLPREERPPHNRRAGNDKVSISLAVLPSDNVTTRVTTPVPSQFIV